MKTPTNLAHRLVLAALILVTAAAASGRAAEGPAGIVDHLVFGDPASEAGHGLKASGSDVVKGGLDEPARRLLPAGAGDWAGGTVSFRIKVDPARPNYFTVRFWGGDVTSNRLFLYCEGKQVGYRHLGDIEQLDYGSDEPAYNGRFFYNTTPLPPDLTRGKTELTCEIRSTGRIWGYGRDFAQYQKPMTEPTRGIYRAYTHGDGCFVPPADERQGDPPATPTVRKSPGPEVLEQVKQRVNREVEAQLKSDRPMHQMQMSLLAKAYHVKWTAAHANPRAVQRLVQSLDETYRAYVRNPRLAQEDPVTWNPDWFGLGPSGQVIDLMRQQLAPLLDETIDDGAGKSLPRRAAYSAMLVASRDWNARNRRLYTNQSMIKDLYGIYLCNRGIAVVDPAKAMPEAAARRYLYESVGLQPWLGSDTDRGPSRSAGDSYFQLTAKGLTKELGYVGSYGEVLDWMNDTYEATRPAPGQPGDEKIRAQLIKAARARAYFRHPALDAEGNRTMRLEQVVGWRDSHYPGDVVYGQRPSRDASALQTAAATLEPELVGHAQQMIADNQFFWSEAHVMSESVQALRITIGRLHTPDQLELIKAQPPSGSRLPMTWDQPDFVFSDEEDGVVALKNGQEIFYASLYWRARYGINGLARVHHMTPRFDRTAIVRQETQFDPSGKTYTRANWTNFGFGNGGIKYPGDFRSAHAGEVLPIARAPRGIELKPGDESAYAGKGTFYTLRYGPYLIGMNCTADRTFELTVPADFKPAKELVSGQASSSSAPRKVGPRSTVVLWEGR
ncbi:MAG TPA: hypothetical protein VER17_17425 [Tepidisphaeraceae bacterium]|nr:hypothetical protein [Tepidisphaeraceae bacterium]